MLDSSRACDWAYYFIQRRFVMFTNNWNSCLSSGVSIKLWINPIVNYQSYVDLVVFYNLRTFIFFRCTIVLYNARKNRQSHITNPSRKTFTSLDFSEDGHYLVTGECGHQPHVRVWDVHDKSMIVEFPGHKFGINCVVSKKYFI